MPFEIKKVFFENEEVDVSDLQYDRENQTMVFDKDFSELHIVGTNSGEDR